MISIINHHYIREDFNSKYPSIFGISPKLFEKKLKLYSNNYSILDQTDLVNILNGEVKNNNKSVLITFDDGLKEQFELAFPILEKYNRKAVFFINTLSLLEPRVLTVHKIHIVRSLIHPSHIIEEFRNFSNALKISFDFEEVQTKATMHYKYDNKESGFLKYVLNFILSEIEKETFINNLFFEVCKLNEEHIWSILYMNREQILKLGKLNMIGSHSHDHLPLGQLKKEDQITNVRMSKQILENLIDKPILGFSYPYGNIEAVKGVAEILKSEGYSYGVTTERALNGEPFNRYTLARLDNNDTTYGKNYFSDSKNFFNTYTMSKWKI
jgi:peptidoglycan/xylan/chitin deacetylase (PgdA/CDA1 family)